MECSADCSCGEHCQNQKIRRGTAVNGLEKIYVWIYYFDNECQVPPIRGYGVQTNSFIPKGAFVTEYLGEVISMQTCYERLEDHYKKNLNYYLLATKNGFVIDATRKGNLMRFVNHSCEPNCFIEEWY